MVQFRLRICLIVAVLTGFSLSSRVLGQSQPQPRADGCCANQSVDLAFARRIEEEFRLASRIPPDLTVKIVEMKPSEVKGFDRGTVEYGRGSQTLQSPFYISSDRQFLFFGDVINLRVDRRSNALRYLSTVGQYVRGEPNAPVTVVEFSDFQCPACAQAYAVVELVLKKYEGKVRLIFKHFPLVTIHDWSEAAAIASECAALQKPDVFWKFHDVFFEEQDEITRENIGQVGDRLVAERGLDRAAFEDCVQRKRTIPRIARSMEEARLLGLKATPTFFVNGQQLVGDISFGAFKRLIDRELALAEGKKQGPR